MEEVSHAAVPFLLDCVSNEEEAPIVRHEVLVSLGDMVEDNSILSQFVNHPDQIVSESCEVAFHYIDTKLAILEQEKLMAQQE